MEFKKVTLKNKATFQKVYITALTQGFDPFVPINFINNFNKNFDEHFFEIFNDKNQFLYICYEEKVPVGVIVFGKSKLEGATETDGFLNSIYFLKAYHGKGSAKQALEFLEEKLKSLNYKKVFLWCSKENKRAWKFYTKHNYTPLENKTWNDTLDGKVFHNILFVKDI